MNAKELGEQSAYAVDLRTPSQITLGLTKRELFAAMAMQGNLADPASGDRTLAEIASDSVAMADALLAELAKEQP